ncbi:MAG: hypothetical protein DWH91_11840 [Planctomycetota bacterium]|nr:MAG: hypothetical protein DWH91_11840 [Planctomycetota bacterium]
MHQRSDSEKQFSRPQTRSLHINGFEETKRMDADLLELFSVFELTCQVAQVAALGYLGQRSEKSC